MKNKLQNKKHFSHHHILIPLQPEQGDEINCEACAQPISDLFPGCLSCNFYLHDGCTNAPRSLDHPAHPTHPLTLLPTPTYSIQSYFCNACGSKSNAYSFSCAKCEFDLHMQCASTPNTMLLKQHPHKLKLVFASPYADTGTKYRCDVCSGDMNPEHWMYYCRECDYGAHLGCAQSKGRAGGYIWKQNYEGASSRDEKVEDEEEKEDEETMLFEAQKRSRENHISHQMMIQSLHSAADLIGPAYTRKYYKS